MKTQLLNLNKKEEENNDYIRYNKQELKQDLNSVQQFQYQHILDSQSPQEKDQIIMGLVSKINIMASEIFTLSDIVDSLMYDQKLAKEKYETLKSRFNAIAMGQQKEDIINSNPYKHNQTGHNALRYNQYSKKEMHSLLSNADNKSPTSPRRVISSMGILYKDRLISQQILRDRISELENELAVIRIENNDIKQRLDVQNQLTFGKQTTENDDRNDYDQDNSGKKAFSNYHSIDTMVQRYQGM